MGFALLFLNFSTWTGQHGITRKISSTAGPTAGRLGRALLAELARICVSAATPGWSGRSWTGTPGRQVPRLAQRGGRWTNRTVDRLAGPALRALAGPRFLTASGAVPVASVRDGGQIPAADGGSAASPAGEPRLPRPGGDSRGGAARKRRASARPRAH